MKPPKEDLLDPHFRPLNSAFILLAMLRLSNEGTVPAGCPMNYDEDLYQVINDLLSRFHGLQCEAEDFAEQWRETANRMPYPMTSDILTAPENSRQIEKAFKYVAIWNELTKDKKDLSAARKWVGTLSFEERCALSLSLDLAALRQKDIASMIRTQIKAP